MSPHPSRTVNRSTGRTLPAIFLQGALPGPTPEATPAWLPLLLQGESWGAAGSCTHFPKENALLPGKDERLAMPQGGLQPHGSSTVTQPGAGQSRLSF